VLAPAAIGRGNATEKRAKSRLVKLKGRDYLLTEDLGQGETSSGVKPAHRDHQTLLQLRIRYYSKATRTTKALMADPLDLPRDPELA